MYKVVNRHPVKIREVIGEMFECHFVDLTTYIQGGPKKPDHFSKYVTSVYDDVGRRSVYQNVQLFIGSTIFI